MADLVAFTAALNRANLSEAERDAFVAQGFDSLQSLGDINLTFLRSAFKAIRSAGLLPNGAPFSIRASRNIEVLAWLSTNLVFNP